MDLKQIRYFTYVANLRSFSKAAKILSIAQPALSRHIQSLEAELRTPLLHRTTRGVEPTPAGLTLLSRGEALLRQAEEVRAAVLHSAGHPNGNVVVGVPPSLSASFAPLILEECSQACPDVTVRIIEGLSVFHEEWINLGRVDLAVLTTTADSPKVLREQELFWEEMVLVASRDFEFAQAEAVTLPEIARFEITTSHGFRMAIDEIANAAGITLRYANTFDSIPILKEILTRGRCVSILPYIWVEKEHLAESLPVVRITAPTLRRRIVVAWNSARPVSPALEAVRDSITRASARLTVTPR